MLSMDITKSMIEQATHKSKEMGKLKNSITKGDGNLAGFIGEALVAQYLGAIITNTYDYDLVYEKLKIDVKTKRTTVAPKPHYECSVADYNTQQGCDWYVFTRVANDLKMGWILGYMPKSEFYKKAKKYLKGEYDSSNGFYFKADCYNIKIDQLYELKKLSDYIILTGSRRGLKIKVRKVCIEDYDHDVDTQSTAIVHSCGVINVKETPEEIGLLLQSV